MAEHTESGRRTALTTIGTVVAAAIGVTTVGTTRTAATSVDGVTGSDLTGIYDGTVDRIVDGEHVVILIEEGGEVIDQQVVSADEYPDLEEGDAVTVLLYDGNVLFVW